MNTPRTRSPNFPVVDLEAAVEFTRQIEQIAKRHPIPTSAVIEKAWKLKAGSSRGLQLVAALKQFGLIQDEGAGESRHVKLTEEGAKVVLNHPDRSRLIKDMALAPKIHSHIWNQYGGGSLPPDETLTHYLLFDHEPPFNSSSIDAFLKQFRNTIDFSGLGLSTDKMDTIDYNGDSQNDEINVSADINRAEDKERVRDQQKPRSKIGMRQEIFTLDEGDIVLEWPEKLSQASYEDFESWIQIVLRKAKRAVADKKDEVNNGLI